MYSHFRPPSDTGDHGGSSCWKRRLGMRVPYLLLKVVRGVLCLIVDRFVIKLFSDTDPFPVTVSKLGY